MWHDGFHLVKGTYYFCIEIQRHLRGIACFRHSHSSYIRQNLMLCLRNDGGRVFLTYFVDSNLKM